MEHFQGIPSARKLSTCFICATEIRNCNSVTTETDQYSSSSCLPLDLEQVTCLCKLFNLPPSNQFVGRVRNETYCSKCSQLLYLISGIYAQLDELNAQLDRNKQLIQHQLNRSYTSTAESSSELKSELIRADQEITNTGLRSRRIQLQAQLFKSLSRPDQQTVVDQSTISSQKQLGDDVVEASPTLSDFIEVKIEPDDGDVVGNDVVGGTDDTLGRRRHFIMSNQPSVEVSRMSMSNEPELELDPLGEHLANPWKEEFLRELVSKPQLQLNIETDTKGPKNKSSCAAVTGGSGPICRVPNCRTLRKDQNCSLFLFPSDNARKLIWCRKMGLNPAEVMKFKYTYICGLHFQPNQFKSSQKMKLKSNAIPTIILVPPNTETARNGQSRSRIIGHLPFLLPKPALEVDVTP